MEYIYTELQDGDGNIYYLKTDASNVYCSDGNTVETKLRILNQKIENASIDSKIITVNEDPTEHTKVSIDVSEEEIELAEMSDVEKVQNQVTVNEEPTKYTKLNIRTGDQTVDLAEMTDVLNIQNNIIEVRNKIDQIQYQTKNINITDLDSVTEPGLYSPGLAWENVSNVPNDTKDRPIYGYLRVTKYCNDANGICQELYDIYTGIPVIYIRRYFNGSWGSWYKFSGIVSV